MHLVTLFCLAAAVCSVTGLQGGRRLGRLLRRLCLGVGVLGTLFGVLAALGAGHSAASEDAPRVLMRGMAVALNPSIWALVLVGLSSLVVGVVRARRVGRAETPTA